MERSNQPPELECCRREGQAGAAQEGGGAERLVGGVHREIHEPQAGVAPRLSNPASKLVAAGGDALQLAELNTAGADTGKASADLPGSQNVAREETAVRNQGDPVISRRTSYEHQAGRPAQRREGQAEGKPGVGSAHSIQRQGASSDAGEGADALAKPTQATLAVRTTDRTGQPSCERRERVSAKSPVREYCTPGSVRGAPGNRRPYLDNPEKLKGSSAVHGPRSTPPIL
jgi:hypothetical protein